MKRFVLFLNLEDRKRFFTAVTVVLFALMGTGCFSMGPAPRELGDDYYRDFEYNPADGRWYHKTPPVDARDIHEYGAETYQRRNLD